jgi:hypothetical protein
VVWDLGVERWAWTMNGCVCHEVYTLLCNCSKQALVGMEMKKSGHMLAERIGRAGDRRRVHIMHFHL